MPNDVEKESKQARRWEEHRRRRNELRLEGQRKEYERKCEALRRKAAAVEEGDAAAHSQNEGGWGEEEETRVDQLGDKDLEEPQPLEEAALAASRSDGQRKRPRNPKRRAEAKAETNASPTPAKNEHPELHVIAQVMLRAQPPPRMTKH
jgi:hypothetical protein